VFFIFKNNYTFVSIMRNLENMQMDSQSIRKIWKKCDFLDIFLIFSIFSNYKKLKKTSKWTEKNEHQRFFSCFSKFQSTCGLAFFKMKNARFFCAVFGPFCFCGAMLSRQFDFLNFCEQTDNVSARFF